jgi:hypothetical protein
MVITLLFSQLLTQIILSCLDFNDRFAKSSGDDAVARYKKQSLAAAAAKSLSYSKVKLSD